MKRILKEKLLYVKYWKQKVCCLAAYIKGGYDVPDETVTLSNHIWTHIGAMLFCPGIDQRQGIVKDFNLDKRWSLIPWDGFAEVIPFFPVG